MLTNRILQKSPGGGGGGGGGTPYVMGDTYVPRFWPPFSTLAGSSTIFLGYFFSSANTKTIFCGIKTTNSYRIRSFRPQISFFPRSFWVQFSAASGTPPSFFGPSTPPPPPPPRAKITQWEICLSQRSHTAHQRLSKRTPISTSLADLSSPHTHRRIALYFFEVIWCM